MQPLFSTELTINNQPVLYHVVFEKDQYEFLPEDTEKEAFSFIRKHDEWQELGIIEPQLKSQAIEKLEAYLLAQL